MSRNTYTVLKDDALRDRGKKCKQGDEVLYTEIQAAPLVKAGIVKLKKGKAKTGAA